VSRLIAAAEPPRYRREPAGSRLDPLERVIAKALEECAEIKAPRMTEILREHGYQGSVDLVKRRLRELRPPSERPAQRTGYRRDRPGLQLGLAARRSSRCAASA